MEWEWKVGHWGFLVRALCHHRHTGNGITAPLSGFRGPVPSESENTLRRWALPYLSDWTLERLGKFYEFQCKVLPRHVNYVKCVSVKEAWSILKQDSKMLARACCPSFPRCRSWRDPTSWCEHLFGWRPVDCGGWYFIRISSIFVAFQNHLGFAHFCSSEDRQVCQRWLWQPARVLMLKP